jgi:CheY-like chemotaxis protein
MPGAGLTAEAFGKARPDSLALKPYWGKPAVRNFREGDGDVGIIRSPLPAIALPDLPTHVAIDLIMPRMDGVEVLARLAACPCAARIIVTSGVGSRVLDSARRFVAEHGLNVVGVMSKPFSPAAFRALLTLDDPPGAEPRRPPEMAARGAFEVTADELARALECKAFAVVLPARDRMRERRACRLRPLVRWHRPQAGVVMPDRFIGVAEQAGLIDGFSEQVFGQDNLRAAVLDYSRTQWQVYPPGFFTRYFWWYSSAPQKSLAATMSVTTGRGHFPDRSTSAFTRSATRRCSSSW